MQTIRGGIFDKPEKKLTPKTSMMLLQADLADSGIPYVENGLYFDFHSLRHQTGTLLAASGVHPKVAQKIMRHSDINLTMSRYTHTLTGQEAKAVADLPDLTLPSNKSQTQKATGTDNQPVRAYKPAYKKLTKNAYSGFNQSSLVGIESKGENKISNCHKSSETGMLGSDKDSMSMNDNEWAGADLNRRHTDFQSVALPTELPARKSIDIYSFLFILSSTLVVKKQTKTTTVSIQCLHYWISKINLFGKILTA